MKINDKKELHNSGVAELKKMLKDGNELLATLRLDYEQNKLKDTRSLFNTRKKIAVIKTILKGKEESEALPKEAVEKEAKPAAEAEKAEAKEKQSAKGGQEKAVKAAPSTK